MNAITLAERLTEQISAGAEFAAIARNFSQSPTAAVGGSLELDKEVKPASRAERGYRKS